MKKTMDERRQRGKPSTGSFPGAGAAPFKHQKCPPSPPTIILNPFY